MINSPKAKDTGITNHYSPFESRFYNIDFDQLMPIQKPF